jgi:hypothetical protein
VTVKGSLTVYHCDIIFVHVFDVDTTGSPGHRNKESPNICADNMAANARHTILNLEIKSLLVFVFWTSGR